MAFPLSDAYLCSDHECDTIFEGPGPCPKCLNSNPLPLARVLNRPSDDTDTKAEEAQVGANNRSAPVVAKDIQIIDEYPKEEP